MLPGLLNLDVIIGAELRSMASFFVRKTNHASIMSFRAFESIILGVVQHSEMIHHVVSMREHTSISAPLRSVLAQALRKLIGGSWERNLDVIL